MPCHDIIEFHWTVCNESRSQVTISRKTSICFLWRVRLCHPGENQVSSPGAPVTPTLFSLPPPTLATREILSRCLGSPSSINWPRFPSAQPQEPPRGEPTAVMMARLSSETRQGRKRTTRTKNVACVAIAIQCRSHCMYYMCTLM